MSKLMKGFNCLQCSKVLGLPKLTLFKTGKSFSRSIFINANFHFTLFPFPFASYEGRG